MSAPYKSYSYYYYYYTCNLGRGGSVWDVVEQPGSERRTREHLLPAIYRQHVTAEQGERRPAALYLLSLSLSLSLSTALNALTRPDKTSSSSVWFEHLNKEEGGWEWKEGEERLHPALFSL